MPRASSVTRLCLLLFAGLLIASWSPIHAQGHNHALTLPADKNSVVRFFYQPPEGEYFHVALIFRVVEENDPRWNTTTFSDEGRTAFVSLSDMQQLLTNLAHLPLQWDESAEIETLETYKTIHSYGYGMGIKVLSTKGTAKSLIRHDKICETLPRLDGALPTPRALWEFQGFRLQYHCQVPTYDPDAYPSSSAGKRQ